MAEESRPGVVRALAGSIAVLLVLGLVGAGTVGDRHGSSDTSSAPPATIPAAPDVAVGSLVMPDGLPGFAMSAERALTLDEVASTATDVAVATARLQSQGFRGGYSRTWRNQATHQFEIVAIGEYGNPGAAASHKRDLDLTIAKREGHAPVPVAGIAGAIGAHWTTHVDGKLPQSIDAVLFRVDRWFFEVEVGANLGAPTSVDITPETMAAAAAAEYAHIQPTIGYLAAPPVAAGAPFAVRDRGCGCGFEVPGTWDVMPFDAQSYASTVSAGAAYLQGVGAAVGSNVTPAAMASLGRSFITSAAQPAAEGGAVVTLVRARGTTGLRSDPAREVADAFRAMGAQARVDTVRLGVGRARRDVLTVPVAAPSATASSITAVFIIFVHRGSTYALFYVVPGDGDHAAAALAIARTIRFDR